MRHVIMGSGVVGLSTGSLLEAHGEDVIYYDINNEVVVNLQRKGKKATEVMPSDWDVAWMCTHEKWLPSIIPSRPSVDSTIVVRSTVDPDFFKLVDKEYVIHMPEFLREKTSIEDTFFPDRVVIGADQNSPHTDKIVGLISGISVDLPVLVVPHEVSAFIKLISNAWLSTQISFWNEMYKILECQKQYRQIIANIVTMDHRISDYGSILTGKKFGGKCLPKDLDHLLQIYEESKLLKAVKDVNEEME